MSSVAPASEGSGPCGRPRAPTYPSALDLTLQALRPLLADPEVTEVCINRPLEAFVETRCGWRHQPLPFADFDWCRRLAKLVAHSTRQRVDETSPLLSASQPSNKQKQNKQPPTTTHNKETKSKRQPTDKVW